jgi:transcriptional regulator with XRE-family HTH domain
MWFGNSPGLFRFPGGFPMTVLRAIRLLTNKPVDEMAALIGLQPSNLNGIERGMVRPRQSTARRLEGFFNQSIHSLLSPVEDVLRFRERNGSGAQIEDEPLDSRELVGAA